LVQSRGAGTEETGDGVWAAAAGASAAPASEAARKERRSQWRLEVAL
jgi:hypothetical protein